MYMKLIFEIDPRDEIMCLVGLLASIMKKKK